MSTPVVITMHEWTMQAARGERPWICAGCCMSSTEGMPDECLACEPGSFGAEQCNAIIARDKLQAQEKP